MSYLDITFNWILVASLKTLPLVLLIFLLQRYAKKYIRASNIHVFWLLVLLSFSLPLGWQFSPNLNLPQTSRFGVDNAALSEKQNNSSLLPGSSTPSVSSSGPKLANESTQIGTASKTVPSKFDLKSMAIAIWAVGVLILLAGIARQSLTYRRIRNEALPPQQEVINQFDKLKIRVGIHTNVKILSSQKIESPLTLGIWNPLVLFPEHLIKKLSDQEIEHILLHELTHIKRRDIAFCWLASLVTILHWFNPAAWLALKAMRNNLEIACDAQTLKSLKNQQHPGYGETLINLSDQTLYSQHSQLVVGVMENHHHLKERISMINHKYRHNAVSRLFILLIASIITLTVTAQPQLEERKKAQVVASDANSIELREFASKSERTLKTTVLVGPSDASKNIRAPKNVKNLDYGKFLSILKINDYTAFRTQDFIQVIALKRARSSAIPVVEPNKKYFQDEFVTDHITLSKACSFKILPVIRPLLPQHSHIASMHERTLIISDTWGNIQRLRQVINNIEGNMNKQETCDKVTFESPKKIKKKPKS